MGSWTARWADCWRFQRTIRNLRSNQNFLQLQDELAGTENRIAVERRRYNLALQDYNTFIGLFPNSIWAGIAGYHRNDAYFEGTAAAQQVPKVDFSGK